MRMQSQNKRFNDTVLEANLFNINCNCDNECEGTLE
jgi:hypothetical protein